MGINIRIVRKGHGSKKVLAELYNANPLELPIKTETINVDGFEERVLSVTKVYEYNKHNLLDNVYDCWFEVDVT
ncbi:hypothetical protein [Escherichia phage AV117]|uniref:hypothetical protein n=1 Tax=Escherichia coli TaxID=562 RepID=UPI0010BC8EE4|nr:hypothetical protein [Escherichia coli]QBP05583.1 hypothetical protein [Escherichia phage PHB12]WPK35747.1 hypothetical protein [Escherichia phage AV117]